MYSFCIIGGGPAGLVLAQALLRKTAANEIIIIEAGGRVKLNERAADFISVGETKYKPFRQFRFGGHGHLWGGACPRLHPNDFKMQSLYGHYTDWPLDYDELVPFYEQAEKMLQVTSRETKLPPSTDPFVETVKSAGLSGSLPYGDRSYFVSKLLPEISDSGIKLALDCVVRRIESLSEGGARVNYFNEYTKKTEKIDANKVILCSGGLSNARLLQLSQSGMFPDVAEGTLPALGKYFMDHPRVILELENKKIERKKAMLSDGNLPTTLIKNVSSDNHDVAFGSISASRITSVELNVDSVQSAISNASIDEIQKNLQNKITLFENISIDLEAMDPPLLQNSVELADKLDPYGDPMLATNINISDVRNDINNKIISLIERPFLGGGYKVSQLRRSGWTGQHPSGSTRMGESPDTGVVDKNLKVFGVNDVYVCGSSVFPTVGYSNPTLTIVALALRLAEHIHE
mgnify:CR=1 FL=1|jgi:glucose dehydrogenase